MYVCLIINPIIELRSYCTHTHTHILWASCYTVTVWQSSGACEESGSSSLTRKLHSCMGMIAAPGTTVSCRDVCGFTDTIPLV